MHVPENENQKHQIISNDKYQTLIKNFMEANQDREILGIIKGTTEHIAAIRRIPPDTNQKGADLWVNLDGMENPRRTDPKGALKRDYNHKKDGRVT